MKTTRLVFCAALGLAALAVQAQVPPEPVEPLGAVIVPPSLKTVTVIMPPNLGDFVRDRFAAVQLGKALFWDMQTGSDGVTACASCHFHAGADGRTMNQVNPAVNAGDTTFQVIGPNGQLSPAQFPFHRLADPDQADSAVLADSNDVASSMGVFKGTFTRSRRFVVRDVGVPASDPVFHVGAANTRRVPGRNSPSVINAAMNFANFWDGRANPVFNGVNPFGPSDQTHGIFVNNGTVMSEQLVRFPFSSLASQAVGPPLNDVEMSLAGRTWPDVGRKMLTLRPLAKQMVHPQDSILGLMARARLLGGRPAGLPGLRQVSYAQMVKAAFHPKYWDSLKGVRFNADGTRTILARPPHPAFPNEYSQMEANFSLFFGLAVQMYEATLISDDSPYDRFQDGNANALTPLQKQGLDIFMNQGQCILCHFGAEFTAASVGQALALVVEPLPEVTANLTGAKVVPPLATAGTGIFSVTVDQANARLVVRLDLAGLADVTLGQIHVGGAAANGPAIFTVYDVNVDGLFNRRVRKNLTAADFTPGGGLATYADAVAAIMAGNTYFLVQTLANPAGELRGQLVVPVPARIELMPMEQGLAFYDVGYYNLGARPTTDDVGRGGVDPFGFPLSFSRLGLLKRDGLLPPALAALVPSLPPGTASPPDRVSVSGAFKTPSLRNAELTGPYMHNGGMATLRQVVDFYARGGDFHTQNLADVNPIIVPLGFLQGNPAGKDALVAFLLSLTDERVRQEMAPFDHPQLFVPNGLLTAGTNGRFYTSLGFNPTEDVTEVPAVGTAGRPPLGLPPLGRFLNLDPFQP
jgi:cytochrome c peroxidase